jgi:hypothetical protein
VSVQRHASREESATHFFFFSFFFFEEKKNTKTAKTFFHFTLERERKGGPGSAQLSIQITKQKNKFPVLPYTRSHQKFSPFLYCVSSIKKPLAKSRRRDIRTRAL